MVKLLNDAKISKKQPAQVAIGLDLSALPPYAQDTNYLHQHLQLKTDNADYKIASIILADNVSKGDLKKNELDDLANSTHIFVLDINDVYKTRGDAANGVCHCSTIPLTGSYPSWTTGM